MRCLNNRVVFATVVMVLVAFTQPLVASTDFTIPPGRSSWPYAMVVGPDKNLWFVEWGGQKVGRITTAGVVTEFPIANAQALIGIASGPDGNLWFTDMTAEKIGHISTSGTNIVQYSLAAGSFPEGITAGPDGNLWFVEQKATGDYEIGKITTAGKVAYYSTKETAGPFEEFGSISYINFGVIAAGPDGNLWFVNPQNNLNSQVGKITTAGAITFYGIGDQPLGITSGPDGNLWVIEASHVAKVSTSGTETPYPITHGGYAGIVTGPDGNIWFAESTDFGKVVPSTGVVTEYAALYPAFEYSPSIVSGPDGNLWFTSPFTGNIGRMTTAASITGNFVLNAGAVSAFNTAGPDGNLWFTMDFPANGVGKMTPTGVVTTCSLPTANAAPAGITAGPDGNVWLVENVGKNIAKVTPACVVTEYPISGTSFFGIVTGPDGNLWFPYIYARSCGCSAIGRMNTSGTVTGVFPTTTALSSPVDVTVGPDGNIWFTESGANQIGKMSTAGVMLAEYPVKTANANLSAITAGPDGNMWFLENTEYGAVGRVTMTGVVTEHKAELQGYQNGLVAGSDGALWFAQGYPNSVGRISTKGVVSTVPLTAVTALGSSLTLGPDHKIWVAEGIAGALGRLSAIGGTGQNFTATHGVGFTGGVASFVDGTPTAAATNFTATIHWGDGTTSSGTISGSTGGPFTVKGTHTYSAAGTYHPYAALSDSVDKSTYTSTTGKATVN